MHSGFATLRALWPMNARARNRHTAHDAATRGGRRAHRCRSGTTAGRASAAGGPWLFGDYSIADAMFAPVVLRFNTYGAVAISPAARWYMASVLEDAALQEWLQAAKAGDLD